MRFEQLLFLRIGKVGGFQKHGGGIRQLQHTEGRLVKRGIFQHLYAADLVQQIGRVGLGQVDGVGLKHVQDDFVGLIVAFAPGHAADDVGEVFIPGQQFGGFVAGRSRGQTINGAALGLTVAGCIRVDTDKEACLVLARHAEALAEGYVIISVAGQDRPIPGHLVDGFLDLPADGQHNMLFVRPVFADGAGIFSAVAGIDHDDPPGGRDGLAFHNGRSFFSLRQKNIHHDAVRLVHELLQRENFRAQMIFQMNLNRAELILPAYKKNFGDARLSDDFFRRQRGRKGGVGEFQDDPVLLNLKPVCGFVAEIENNARLIGRRPMPHIGYLR